MWHVLVSEVTYLDPGQSCSLVNIIEVYILPHQLVLKRIVTFSIWIVASLMIECWIIGAHTHIQRCMHPCMHASIHAHMHTQSSCGKWHAQLAENLFANNLKVFPYQTPQRPRFTWSRHIIRLRHMKDHVRADYITTQIFVYVLWYSNGAVILYYSFHH